jgi:monofunctional biosynthetic peptidoglycan transglycosylase
VSRGRVLLGVFGLIAAGVAAAVIYEVATWPDVAALATHRPERTAFIDAYRARQRAAGARDRVDWRWVPYDAISVHLARAVVAGEDMEFFFHHGFSTSEIRAAIREAVEEGGGLRGASTITQQLAKNLWLSPSRNPWRKVKEALLTRDLERHLTKRRILELYLNVVEFGPGIYGAEAAAEDYFGEPASALTEHQAAMLAASLPRPSTWHPGSTSQAYARYVTEIEARMARATFLWRRLGVPAPAVIDTVTPTVSDTVPADTIRTDHDSIGPPGGDSVPADTGVGGAEPPDSSRPLGYGPSTRLAA